MQELLCSLSGPLRRTPDGRKEMRVRECERQRVREREREEIVGSRLKTDGDDGVAAVEKK